MVRRGGRVIALQREQAQIKNIVVFIGVQLRGTTQIALRLGYLALPGPRDREIVQNFWQVRTGNHVVSQRVLEGNEHFLRAVRLTEEQAADARRENRFRVTV